MRTEALRGAAHRMVACPYCHRICLEENDDSGYLVHLAGCTSLNRASLPQWVQDKLSDALAHAMQGAAKGRTAGYDSETEDGSVEEKPLQVSLLTWTQVWEKRCVTP